MLTNIIICPFSAKQLVNFDFPTNSVKIYLFPYCPPPFSKLLKKISNIRASHLKIFVLLLGLENPKFGPFWGKHEENLNFGPDTWETVCFSGLII